MRLSTVRSLFFIGCALCPSVVLGNLAHIYVWRENPTSAPSASPTFQPSASPSSSPSVSPTARPSYRPSLRPSSSPTISSSPTYQPTALPIPLSRSYTISSQQLEHTFYEPEQVSTSFWVKNVVAILVAFAGIIFMADRIKKMRKEKRDESQSQSTEVQDVVIAPSSSYEETRGFQVSRSSFR